MNDAEWLALAERFEGNRAHLRAVAYRMLGSLNEADDAVQEAWIRLSRSDADSIDNLSGWLTTVVGRVCLDMLRSRTSRREDLLGEKTLPEPASGPGSTETADPEHEALLADSVGLALLVVLETLDPAERLAFVLHDMFAVSFGEIAPIVGRTPAATRQLASRARRRVQGNSAVTDPDVTRQRAVVDAFLAAARGGDFEALLELLDPDIVLRTDPVASGTGAFREIRGAEVVAAQARQFWERAQFSQAALVNGAVGVVVAPLGRLAVVMDFTVKDGKVVEIDIVGEADRLDAMDLAVLGD
ncbi:sigma-70 family RNA polymerase sigma factor [Streptomyces sp. NPDC006879]|uniref:sigma-70 family RNA polymerase sigma factor n=1 Tax=Streptomyces sp. NPDC006879 TaxID=3364767 RepID=UPI0036A11681